MVAFMPRDVLRPTETEPRVASGRRHVLRGSLLAAAGAILFSTKSILVKLAFADGTDAETLLALRMLISLPIYAAICMILIARGHARRWSVGIIGQAASVGALGYWVSGILDFKGLEFISAQLERLILFTYPLFVVLLGAVFFRQRIGQRAFLAFALSYGGLALVFTRSYSTIGHDALLGSALVLAAAVTFALYQLLAKHLIGIIGAQSFTCLAMIAASIAAVLSFLARHGIDDALVTPYVFCLATILAIGGTVLPSFLLNAALQLISAQMNAMIGMLSPIATIILAVALLGEQMTGADVAGAVLVLVGIGAFTVAESRRS